MEEIATEKGNYKKNQIDILILKCKIHKMKISLDRLNKRLEMAEENINKLEGRLLKNYQI